MTAMVDLLNHREPAIRELGQKAVRYRSQYDKGEITVTEYNSLCDQLTDLEALQAAAESAELRQAFAEAVGFLRTYLPVLL